MKLDPILTKAVNFARRKKYDDAIKILETEATRYYGSFMYYYLLGISYLYSNIFGVALTYLKQAYKLKMRDINTLLGLAVLYLNHGDTDKAVDLYLEVQSIDSSNRIAKKALKLLRKFPGQEKISTWIDSGRLPVLFPPFPRLAISRKRLFSGVAATAAIICIAFVIAVMTGMGPFARDIREIPIELALTAEEMESPVQVGGVHRFILTRNQVLDEYNEALRLFAEYRDDAARVRLNRILESNASEAVKNRARLIISFMEVPGFDTLRDRFSFSEVISDPFLFRDTHVIWRGMATNLNIQQNHTSFDFLVGYDTFQILEGIVQVDYDFAIPINPARPVEILGRIIPISTERGLDIRIQGVSLNQAGLLERR